MEFSLAQSLAIADQLARIFESLGVPYAIGGSVASSLHGFPRSTMDVDFVAALKASHSQEMTDRLGDDFYFSKDAIDAAIARNESFNLIELKTMLKLDVFVAGARHAAQLSRAQQIVTEDGHRFAVVTAEDIVAEKLRWFRLGGETSERQWKDLVGVLEVQGSDIQLDVLNSRCAELGVMDLLSRAIGDARQ